MDIFFKYNIASSNKRQKDLNDVQVRRYKGKIICTLEDLNRSLAMIITLFGRDCLDMDVMLFGDTIEYNKFRITMSRNIVIY